MLQAFQSHGVFKNFMKISNYALSMCNTHQLLCIVCARIAAIIMAPNMLYSRIRFLWSEVLPENQQHLMLGLFEKHAKFEKICLMVLTNQLIYLVDVKIIRQIFLKLCVLLKKSEL